MSTVLWANYLLDDGEVVSDESDKWALFEYSDTLDEVASAAGLEPFSSLIDDTDFQFNLSDADELPDGMESSDELMARDGVWRDAGEALVILNGLYDLLVQERPEDIAEEDYDDLLNELSESIEYARQAHELGAKFNLAVIM
ncbi:hypothetical protein GWK36_13280 [Caldichromatium japonicum]|uniref:Uncharacterized protein n=1 Tax=Caldichromatium japonicum TaxID=2699430 RepID=A0A6G7VFJ1_9GAMM|nr:hypothetical protein [Caldichromatium japonicum]QIK38791.1 hypothetical protein GWK36_13280 [Caldichromatium japonicum]